MLKISAVQQVIHKVQFSSLKWPTIFLRHLEPNSKSLFLCSTKCSSLSSSESYSSTISKNEDHKAFLTNKNNEKKFNVKFRSARINQPLNLEKALRKKEYPPSKLSLHRQEEFKKLLPEFLNVKFEVLETNDISQGRGDSFIINAESLEFEQLHPLDQRKKMNEFAGQMMDFLNRTGAPFGEKARVNIEDPLEAIEKALKDSKDK